jgi:hypothetical protein
MPRTIEYGIIMCYTLSGTGLSRKCYTILSWISFAKDKHSSFLFQTVSSEKKSLMTLLPLVETPFERKAFKIRFYCSKQFIFQHRKKKKKKNCRILSFFFFFSLKTFCFVDLCDEKPTFAVLFGGLVLKISDKLFLSQNFFVTRRKAH